MCGENLKGCDLSPMQLKGDFKSSALAPAAVVEQLNSLAGLDVADFVPRGAEPGTTGTTDTRKLFWRRDCCLSSGAISPRWGSKRGGRRYTRHSPWESRWWLRTPKLITKRCKSRYTRRGLPVTTKDLEEWSTAVHDAALSAKSNWDEPTGLGELPAVVAPTWTKIRAYIDASGLEHIDRHKDPVATRDKGGRAGKRARRDGDAVQQPCFGWSSQRGCRF